MIEATQALGALATVANGFAAGIMASTVIGIVPMMRAVSYQNYVQMVQFMRPRFDPIMPITNGSALLLDIVAAALGGGARTAHVCAAVLLAAVITISVTKNVPVNKYIMSLDPEKRPADWDGVDPRKRWQAWNSARTIFGVLAFLLNTGAVVWGN